MSLKYIISKTYSRRVRECSIGGQLYGQWRDLLFPVSENILLSGDDCDPPSNIDRWFPNQHKEKDKILNFVYSHWRRLTAVMRIIKSKIVNRWYRALKEFHDQLKNSLVWHFPQDNFQCFTNPHRQTLYGNMVVFPSVLNKNANSCHICQD